MTTAKGIHEDARIHRRPRSSGLESLSVGHNGSRGTAEARPRVHGKFLFVGDDKLYVRGVTYGPLCSGDEGNGYGSAEIVKRDFAQIAARGLNAVRTYTVPPSWLLDAAWEHGLYVMVGLPWEQHIAFLDDPEIVVSIEDRVRMGVRSCTGHPAVLCYAIGNEIPASIVRWHDRAPVQRFLERLYRVAKDEDPEALVTYVNYPSTEYLRLPFLDFVCFNVYLEQQERLASYLARLQNIAGSRPLVMAEIGLDSRSHGKERQAEVLEWQVRTALTSGCAGAFVFSWTDEWYRGGQRIEDWAFGLTTADRQPKPALERIEKAFADSPAVRGTTWPRISIVVCSFNGSLTIDWCLRGLAELEYPDYEVIVVDDGSTDGTGEIVRRHDVRLIRTVNCGLSHARNVGMGAATGEVVAYIDDDASPDPQWLTYLATAFRATNHVGVGGPNLPPTDDGPIADCVANAPGGPIHVLLSDEEAEHIPGCNMAFRKSALEAIGGFDCRFRVAGDDVDICWRLQERGWTLGFSAAAVVWHRRRPSFRAYWKQQMGYGKAEALLERKWPEKYNTTGHLSWAGRLYGNGLTYVLGWRRRRIYHGVWGSALFQSIYEPAPGFLASLPLMPEWYLVVVCLAALSIFGVLWTPLFVAFPFLLVAAIALVLQAGLGASHAQFSSLPPSRRGRWKLRLLTGFLYLLQPLARLIGRFRHGLTPWRWHSTVGHALPYPRQTTVWSERWQSAEIWLCAIETRLRDAEYGRVIRGGAFDRWDLAVQGGIMSGTRIRMAIEEHGGGRQLLRVRLWPKWSPLGITGIVLLAALAVTAILANHTVAAVILAVWTLLLVGWGLEEAAAATGIVLHTLDMGVDGPVTRASAPRIEEGV